MALSDVRMTPSRDGNKYCFDVAASVTCYQGGLAVLDSSGNVKPGVTGTGLQYVGRFVSTVDNSSGSAGDVTAEIERGVYRWGNSSSTDEITAAEIGDVCYIVDDETVAKTIGSTRSPAGVVVDVDAIGVWVQMPTLFGADGDLVAANNLSDVASAGTSRSNLGLGSIATQAASAVAITGGSVAGITDLAVADGGTGSSSASAARLALGANQITMEIDVTDLVGTNAQVKRVVAPCALTVTKIYSVLEGHALATGNASLTVAIAGTPVTDGAVTITQSGSAIGDVDSATPSAANTATAGQVISVTVGGTNDDTDATAKVVILATY
jgi:hypothetical protein